LVDKASIAAMIEPSLRAMGYGLVRVVFTSGRRARLQVMAERVDEASMTVEDCALVSHTVSALLDVSDPIAGAYTLEVSSPGLDRPLVHAQDYDRFVGREAKIELSHPINGQRRFRGRLMGTSDGVVRLALARGEASLPLASVVRAKLVANEELLATLLKKPAGRQSATRS
jgi:ribosome maturation factor RimP